MTNGERDVFRVILLAIGQSDPDDLPFCDKSSTRAKAYVAANFDNLRPHFLNYGNQLEDTNIRFSDI